MREIFIHEWKIQDYAGRREQSIKSDKTINRELDFRRTFDNVICTDTAMV